MIVGAAAALEGERSCCGEQNLGLISTLLS